MNELTSILAEIQNPETSPWRLSEILVRFSTDYARKSGDLQSLLTVKAAKWPALRATAGSDKQADKQWDSSPEGIAEMNARLEMKSLEKLMSALKSHLRNKETEARNMF